MNDGNFVSAIALFTWSRTHAATVEKNELVVTVKNKVEPKSLTSRKQIHYIMNFDSTKWYKFSCMFRGPEMCIDIFNGGDLNNFTHLAQDARYSGQYWKIVPSDRDGYVHLYTMFRGEGMHLDVVNGGPLNYMTHLTPAGNFSGQYWKIEESTEQKGYYRLYTMFTGDDNCLDVFNGGQYNNMQHLTKKGNFSGQYWKITLSDVSVDSTGTIK